jgi:hypothetical protein
MKPTISFLILLLSSIVASSSVSHVQADDSWSWNPFAKSSSSRDSSPIYSKSSSSGSKSSWWPSWKAPKMPWTSSGPKVSSYNRSKTSTWGKINKTTKSWWKNTAEFLDPYPDPKPPKYEEPSRSAAKKSNWFTGMFYKEEPKKVETLPEFLSQETPKF